MEEPLETFSHEDIIDNAALGKGPSEKYLECLELLDGVVRECMHASHGYAGISSPTSRHFYASVLFTALITRSVSLIQLIPFSQWAEKNIEHWDYASATGIVRTMLELRIAFFYLCVDECSEDEWDCRWNIFNLHDCNTRLRLFESFDENDQVEGFKLQAEELRGRLRGNSFFQSLETKKQKTLLNGQVAYLYPLEQIAEKTGMERAQFRWLYILFSSHVHGLPMSFYRLSEGRGRGLPSPTEEGYTSLCISLAANFLAHTRDEFRALFSEFKDKADKIIQKATEKPNHIPEDSFPERLAIGKTITLLENEHLQIEATRKDENSFEFNYLSKPNGELILQRIEAEGESSLEMFDSFFWSVLFDNKAVTQSQMDNLLDHPFAFKIDHDERVIHFKL